MPILDIILVLLYNLAIKGVIMRLLLDIPTSLYEKAKDLSEKGKYSSISEFFVAAGENQIVFEQMPNGKPIDASEIVKPGQIELDRTEEYAFKELARPVKASIVTVEPPSSKELLFKDLPKEEAFFLSGQINRILPMKVGLRVLANMLIDTNDCYIPLNDFVKKATDVAQRLRNLLVSKTLHISGKKDSLWAGLPEPGSDMSCSRYKNQFLAHIRKDAVVDGGLARLRFISLTRKEKNRIYIGITEVGLDFCILENPVIDQHNYSDTPLSKMEMEYYLNHIKLFVAGEFRTFKDILHALNLNITRTTVLNEALAKHWPKRWSKTMVNTHRNGAISRLAELGLITKVKTGIEVEFQITDKGKAFLNDWGLI